MLREHEFDSLAATVAGGLSNRVQGFHLFRILKGSHTTGICGPKNAGPVGFQSLGLDVVRRLLSALKAGTEAVEA